MHTFFKFIRKRVNINYLTLETMSSNDPDQRRVIHN